MKFKIDRDGKKCEVNMKETSKGVKVTTKGKDCKKLLGKDYFTSNEIDFEDEE